MTKKSKLDKFKEKHPPLTDDQIRAKIDDANKAKYKYTEDMKTMDFNLQGLMEIKFPWVNPSTDELLGWTRAPTFIELEEMGEQFDTAKNIDNLKPETRKAYMDAQFDLMAKVIIEPKHDAIWWKSHTNPSIMKLFQLQMEYMINYMGVATENFPNQQVVNS